MGEIWVCICALCAYTLERGGVWRMLMCVYGGSRWVDAGAQAACEKESQIQREHRNVSMSDSSCVHARMCDLHPRNSNMFEVIGLHLGLWCSYIKQHDKASRSSLRAEQQRVKTISSLITRGWTGVRFAPVIMQSDTAATLMRDHTVDSQRVHG